MRSAAVSKARPRTGSAAKPVNPETLTEQAYRQLEEQIVTLRLEPGQSLSEHAPRAWQSAARRSARRCSGWRAKVW
jgi:hypothetical protein